MTMMTDAPPTDMPPAFEVNNVELVSLSDSKITGVSVYSGRAEITRLFKFNVKTGQNQVNISGLPSVLKEESFRVEGRGSATIHDVTISTMSRSPTPTSSDALKALLLKKERTNNALERAKKAITSLETYLGTLNAQHVEVNQLTTIVENYDAAGAQLDDKVLGLKKELEGVQEEIKIETEKLAGPVGNVKLNRKAVIGVFAHAEGEVEMSLIYAVDSASWNAGYDIRVDMHTKEMPVTLVYKAAIAQNTGEASSELWEYDWNDVPLTLETATPTFGLGIPALNRWPLSIYQPVVVRQPTASYAGYGTRTPGAAPPMPMRRRAALSEDINDPDIGGSKPRAGLRTLEVTSKGSVSATFGVPGLISIPSDGVAHSVTIVELKLSAKMSWVAVPKVDAKTHLSAKIKNASEYTLLPGKSSVYVDGSFISRSDVPSVSPDESFDCSLGLDPSIRLTYHPIVKKVSQSGFYNKTANYHYSQRITIHNTKATLVEGLKIIDQVPVSEDEQIVVKMVSPVLPLMVADSSTSAMKVSPPVKVSHGVMAQWDGADEPGYDVGSLGKDGKINWMCAVPPQEKVNLVLQWEVVVPSRTDIVGLSL